MAQPHLVVKRISSCNDSLREKPYLFFLSPGKPALGRVPGTCSEFIVAVKKAPAIYGELEKSARCKDGWVELGGINWRLDGSTATSTWYFPKKNAQKASGLGYYLDLLTCKDLVSTYHVSHVRSSGNPDVPRRRQMSRVGNPPGELIEMARYMRNNAKAVLHKANAHLRKLGQGGLS